jgi:hypothetical protein
VVWVGWLVGWIKLYPNNNKTAVAVRKMEKLK